jgi:uncharacterized protein (TIGR03435 family)
MRISLLASALLAIAHGQTPRPAEFDAASITANAPQSGFHFAADAISGGPGTPDPGMFRCSKCSLATLIVRAFNLQPYQFPGRTSLTENTYDIVATIPAGATAEEFSGMLQGLLRDRFGLTWHFQEKMMNGYHLVIGKNGTKLTKSTGAGLPPAAGSHGQAESHGHSGVVVFGTSASFRAANQSTADLARVLSDQIGLPVDDATGLSDRFDISLRWSGTGGAPVDHSDGAFARGGHDGHDGGGSGGDQASAPTLFDAIQQELGLKLVPAGQSPARLFIVDRVAQRPTEN